MLEASIISSPLWKHDHRMHLGISQRDKVDPQDAAFANHIGEGALSRFDAGDGSLATDTDAFHLQCGDDFESPISFVYPDLSTVDATLFTDRAILSSTNDTIDSINDVVLDGLPGLSHTLKSSDHPMIINSRDFMQKAVPSPENLNSINVTGIPLHQLVLKNKAFLMSTRNRNPLLAWLSRCFVHGAKTKS